MLHNNFRFDEILSTLKRTRYMDVMQMQCNSIRCNYTREWCIDTIKDMHEKYNYLL